MKCTNCGAEVPDGAKFCPECGNKIERKKFCPKCGTEINGGKFCPECGAPLTAGATPSAEKPRTAEESEEDRMLEELTKSFDDLVAKKRQKEEKADEYDRKKAAARTYVIREMYAEAKAIYDGLLEDCPDDMEIYMGYVRIATKNYTEYEGDEIDKSIRVAQRMGGTEDLTKFDRDYAAFTDKRKTKLTSRADEEGKLEANDIGDYKYIGGGYITFGSYPQSKKTNNVKIGGLIDKKRRYYLGSDNCRYAECNGNYYKVEPIKWKVLSRGSECFIVSDIIIDQHLFDGKSNNYANSEIRSWLNGEFYEKAFTESQKERIITVAVDNSLSSTGDVCNSYICGDTNDKIFLLSRKEAKEFLSENESRKRVPTEYAVARGVWQINDGSYMRYGKRCGGGDWWLRSPHYYSDNIAQCVFTDGSLDSNGVCPPSFGVVPALRLKT